MLVWMDEVMSAFKFSDETSYLAVNIMDRYFANTEKTIVASDIHLTGIVSMFIAAKYEEIYPMSL